MIFVRFTISKIRHFQVSLIPGGGGSDSNAQAVLEASVVNNLSLPVVYGVFPLAIKINYMSEHTQGNPGFFSWRAQSFASYSGLIRNMDLHVPRSSLLHINHF